MLRPDDMMTDLRRRSVRAGAAVVVGQIVIIVLNLAATMILARLLTPADFGLVAMVLIILSSAIMLRDLGLMTATIQRQDLNQATVSTLFWVNAALGLLLTAIVFLAAPAVVLLYDQPQLLDITRALAVVSFVDGIAIQHQALIRRHLRLGVLTVVDIIAVAAGLASAIYLANDGYGYWSLVWMQIVQASVRSILCWITAGWRPAFVFRVLEVSELLSFGGSITGARLLNNLTKIVDKILIGRFASAEQLGVYSKAYNGVLLPADRINMAFSRVAVPTLSRLQDDPERFASYYRQALVLITALAFPAVAGLMLEARRAVLIVLGDQWLFAVPLVRILAPVAAVTVVTMTFRWILVSLGERSRLLKWQALDSGAKLLAIVIGVQWGAAGVAWGLLVSSLVLLLPGLWYCYRPTSVRVRDALSSAWKPVLASLVAASAIVAARSYGPSIDNLFTGFAVEAVGFIFIYLFVWLLLPNGRATVSQIFRLARELRPNASSGT